MNECWRAGVDVGFLEQYIKYYNMAWLWHNLMEATVHAYPYDPSNYTDL